jgi:hypothetical protein
MIQKKVREVKIYGKYRPSEAWGCSGEGKDYPWLNVSGKWLSDAGFRINDAVEIYVSEGQLIIKPKAHTRN